jgi:hypothetical protein
MSYTKKPGYLYPDMTQVMIVEAKDNDIFSIACKSQIKNSTF